ncbi:MAG TPA: peptidoglycan DD-metalloendopeptidase family protein [Actinomycetota bacterium]|nr:peptidoglycan DD-metalloendopeptidase family protein [Actinomycetota bacterium]
MTDRHRTFPTPRRAAILAAILALVSIVTTVAGAAPSKDEVEAAKERLARIESELGRIRDQLAVAQDEVNRKAAAVERAQGALEETQAELQRTRAKLDRAEARYERVRERLNERAVEAYMQGPISGLDFVLGAESVAELTDRLAYSDALARYDAEIATQVANLRNELTALQAQLEADRAREARALERRRAEEEEVLAELAEIERLQARQVELLDRAERLYRNRRKAYREFLEQQQAGGSGGRTWNGGPLPEPYDHVFEVCPVDQPRGFGDGFGAPRYGGGYHLHKGVDIVAPYGTPIRAPFDGYSYTSSNGLGGNVVFVVGRYGRAYNAHLSSYSGSSSGPVSAGEVIGYVGSTGYSSVPHDHFEFHPNSIPGPWPVSAYGYSVIEDAINAYPLLIQACG